MKRWEGEVGEEGEGGVEQHLVETSYQTSWPGKSTETEVADLVRTGATRRASPT